MSDFTYRVKINANPWQEVDSFLEGRLRVVNHALRVTQRCLDDGDYGAVRHYLAEISRALGWGPVPTAPITWRWNIVTADGLRDLAQMEQITVRPKVSAGHRLATPLEMATREYGAHVVGCIATHPVSSYCRLPAS